MEVKGIAIASFVTAAVLGASAAAAAAKTFVYVSAAADGVIDGYEMDEATGALNRLHRFEAGKSVMPMTLSPDRRHLYAVVRSQPFRLLTLGIDAATGALTQEAVAALPDSMPYVSTDRSGRLLFTASYGGNKVAVLPINAKDQVVDGVKQVVLTGRNAHSIVDDASGRYVFATNLGSDAVLQFVIDPKTGLLVANDPPSVATPAGYGPRHIALSPDNRFVYVLTELTGHVVQYALDPARGTLKEVGAVASVPADAGLSPGIAPPPPPAFDAPPAPAAAPAAPDPTPRVWAADLGLTPNGRFLYTTERTTSRIALFRVDAGDGSPKYVRTYETEKQPRGIRVDPTGRFLIASGEKSDQLSVYAIGQEDGDLKPVGRYPVSAGANWIEILRTP